jgi:hypothetical protein
MSDNEMDDIWERINLVADEVGGDFAKIERCRNTRRKGVGGGHGGAVASLSNTLQNLSKGAGAAGAGAPPAIAGVLRESEENGYKRNQTDEDVQIRFAAPVVKAKFGYKSLNVTVADQTLCDGDTWGGVAADKSTFTIQDDPNSEGRELCISLAKKDDGETWNYGVMNN